MRITKDMLHPQLRTVGRLIQKLKPAMGPSMFRLSNRFLDLFGAGHSFSCKVNYCQKYITRPDGSRLRLCIYSPKEPRQTCFASFAGSRATANGNAGNSAPSRKKKPTPGLLWIHGGGYALGIPEQDISFIEGFVTKNGCVVVSPDYIRSTDAPYPAALNDCYNALHWMYRNSSKLGIDPDKLAIGGDSAGGGLTAALTLLNRDKDNIPLKLQMPLYPMIDYRHTSTSADNDAPVWNTKSNDAAWEMYLGEAYTSGKVSRYASPALETDYHDLPPTITYVGNIEPFYEETMTYIKHLKSAGVPVYYRVFDGCFHAFDITVPWSAPAKEAREFLHDSFQRIIEKQL